MKITQVLRILWARKGVFLFCLLLTVGTTIGVSLSLPKSYTSTTTVVLAASGSDQVTGQATPNQIKAGYMETQENILGSLNVALRVVEDLKLIEAEEFKSVYFESGPSLTETLKIDAALGWIKRIIGSLAYEMELSSKKAEKGPDLDTLDPSAKFRHWIAETILESITIVPAREGRTIQLSYEGPTPELAAEVANGFARAHIQANLDLRVQPAQQNALWFNERIKVLRDNLSQAQARLSEYKRRAEVITTDSRLDLEQQRLALLTKQVLDAGSEVVTLQTRQEQLRKDLQTGRVAASSFPEILANGLIQKYKVDLATQEAQLAELSERVSKNHPHYQRAVNSVNSIRAELEREVRSVIQSMDSSVKVARLRAVELEAQLAARKAKLLDLGQDYDEISVLEREVESGRQAFELALQRFEQAELEAKSTQTNISVLNFAVPAARASSPRLRLNIMISIILGSVLGGGFAFLIEWTDRRVRAPEDIEEATGMPVIGEIYKGITPARLVGTRTATYQST